MHRFYSLFCISLAVLGFLDVTESKICWTQWLNNSVPMVNGSEVEGLPKPDRDALCGNSPPIDAQCADNKFEGFKGNKTEKKLHFQVMCDVDHGLVCHPFSNTTDKCPDLAIQYGCDCLKMATTLKGASTSPTQSHQTRSQYSGPTTNAVSNLNEKQRGDGNNGAERAQSTWIMMIGCFLLII